MKILKIALKNLNSLKLETVIDFTDLPLRNTGLFAIVGDTGAGKTTILDALTLGLYGNVHRNSNEGEVLSYGAVDGYAEVEFGVKNEIFRSKWLIWRSRSKLDGKLNTKRELAKWNAKKNAFEIIAEKIREINDKVEVITGLDYNRFCKSVLLSQGDFAAFLKANDKERSNLLERITGTNIYSQISIAAFERHKLEEQKLKEIQTELDALEILDTETLNALKNDQKEVQKEIKVEQADLTQIQKQIQWRNRLQELEEQQLAYQQAMIATKVEMEEAKPAFDKFELHQRTLVFQKDLTQFEGLEKQQSTLREEGEDLALIIHEKEKEKQLLSEKTIAIHQELIHFKKEKETQETIFQQVNTLDIQLKEKQIPFENIKTEKKEIEQQVAHYQSSRIALQQKKTEAVLLLEKIATWLKDNAIYKNVAETLPTVRNLYADWVGLEGEKKPLVKEEKETNQQLKQIKKKFHQLEQKNEGQQQALKAAKQEFYGGLGEVAELKRHQVLENLNIEIEQLDGQLKNLEILIGLNNDYQQFLKELTASDEDLMNLGSHRSAIEMELLSEVEILEVKKGNFDFKQKQLEREKLLANYERERTNLKEGEACPVCFATEHPFRKLENYQPYLDRVQAEFQTSKEQFESAQEKVKTLTLELNQISNRIQQIRGEKKLEGKQDMIFKRIENVEAKIAEIAPALKDESLYHTTKEDLLAQKLDLIKTSLKEKRALRKNLLTLDQQILQKEELINQLMQGLNDEKIRLNSWELRNENVQASLGKLETRRTALYSKIDEALNLFELSIKDKEFSKILDLLEKKKSDFEKAVNREVKEKQELALIEQELKQVLQLEKEIGKRLAQIESKYVSLNVELTDLQENRKSIFGDKEVQIVQEELKNQLVALENRVEANKAALNEADIQLKSELAKAQKNNKDLEKIVKAISKDETQLLKKIKRKGFDSILALKMANLEEAEANELEKLKTNLERQLAQNEQSLLDANQEHKKLIAKDLSKDALDTLLEKRQEREALIAETQQKLGRLTQQIEDNNRRQATGKSLLKKMDVQKKEHKRWAKLKEIIGSADGKVFRAFAQGLTLKRLSELANRHLMQLNGRYLIHKPNDQDLALEIIDTHQANNIRSIHTLSGGESFLVSLALALGLSDLAGRNTQINSLFIDEGFGTLDESALDLAISTLENLQSKGKTIGIISHVYALKERIGTQIQVHRKGSGFSDIVLVG